ncbi:MAG: hypothetical protein J6T10_21845 [Methanobrevibacter sp.]|nr:hypothetical protein [Methanobrevibacter sp.]
MKEILDFIFQYGIGTLCVAYLIYDRLTVSKETNNLMLKMIETLNNVNTRLSIIEDKLERKGSDE